MFLTMSVGVSACRCGMKGQYPGAFGRYDFGCVPKVGTLMISIIFADFLNVLNS